MKGAGSDWKRLHVMGEDRPWEVISAEGSGSNQTARSSFLFLSLRPVRDRRERAGMRRILKVTKDPTDPIFLNCKILLIPPLVRESRVVSLPVGFLTPLPSLRSEARSGDDKRSEEEGKVAARTLEPIMSVTSLSRRLSLSLSPFPRACGTPGEARSGS